MYISPCVIRNSRIIRNAGVWFSLHVTSLIRDYFLKNMEMSANKKFLRIEVIILESVGEGRVPNKAGRRCFVTLNMETSTTHAEHIAIKKPHRSESWRRGFFFYYKGFCKIVLFWLVDAEYKFIWVGVGSNGSVSDVRIFN